MPSFSRTTILGHCGQDSKTFTTSSGRQGCNLSVAVSTGKDKPAVWYKVAVFKNDGEYSRIQFEIAQSCRKGDLVLVTGKIGIDSWADKGSGEHRSQLSLTAQEFYKMGAKEREPAKRMDGPPNANDYLGGGLPGPGYNESPNADDGCPF